MEDKRLALILALTLALVSYRAMAEQVDTYIVRLRSPGSQDLDSYYDSFFPMSSESGPHVIYKYRNVLTGLAVKMSVEQVKAVEKKDGFISARPQRILPLHTTHTPNFLGLNQNLGVWKGSNYGRGIIIGLLDTGITPGHPSFSDENMPPPPAKWKGKCEGGVTCNNKLIGARNFVNGTGSSPLDDEGHGTHTSSTAAGNFVPGANVFGNANGTASGMAPLAHVAMYKVCGAFCAESDMLAAMDAAVEEGVDVLSLSIGGPSIPFFDDSIAVGAMTAIQKGIFVSCSAGNSGPYNTSLANEAPWILTVGASTVDRKIIASVFLGNKALINGESLFQPKDFPQTLLPLVFPGSSGNQEAALCAPGSLDKINVKGKVVLCLRGGGIARIAKGQTVKDAGGAAMILMNEQIDGDSTLADAHVLPASHVGYGGGAEILSYINSTASPLATIVFRGTIIGVKTAPEVTSFSSRGPSFASPGILKPDIIGPGVSILAAWPVSVENKTGTDATFNMISGTSMSCPHLAGIAALLKSSHPDWSPAAIKSAMMTSADIMNLNGGPIEDERQLPADIFATGAGHINPSKANDPGLVFDIQPDDYIPYLCGLGYSDKEVEVIVQKPVTCSNQTSIPEPQLNYPSFAITLAPRESIIYSRTVTNVGEVNSTYTVGDDVKVPLGMILTIDPANLEFSEGKQKITYNVEFTRQQGFVPTKPYDQGYFTWVSGKHSVRTPFSVNYL